jgi:hypothetical protein
VPEPASDRIGDEGIKCKRPVPGRGRVLDSHGILRQRPPDRTCGAPAVSEGIWRKSTCIRLAFPGCAPQKQMWADSSACSARRPGAWQRHAESGTGVSEYAEFCKVKWVSPVRVR